MRIFGSLLLLAAVLSWAAAEPINDKYKDLEDVFEDAAFTESTSDSTALAEQGDLFEGDIDGEMEDDENWEDEEEDKSRKDEKEDEDEEHKNWEDEEKDNNWEDEEEDKNWEEEEEDNTWEDEEEDKNREDEEEDENSNWEDEEKDEEDNNWEDEDVSDGAEQTLDLKSDSEEDTETDESEGEDDEGSQVDGGDEDETESDTGDDEDGKEEIDDNQADSTAHEDELFEGDIVATRDEIISTFDPEDIKAMMGVTVTSEDASLQAATSGSKKLWPGAVVPYRLDPTFSTSRRAVIFSAMKEWSSKTCLRFIVRKKQKDYVYFTDDINRCSSHVGRKGGRQNINIGAGCRRGSIIHEIGHAIGFWHEQSRPDRDRFVNILRKNIIKGKSRNFMRRRHLEVDYQGTIYDYGSIMHYGRTFFSKCKAPSYCPTITVNNPTAYAKQGKPNLGQRIKLSTRDILQARRLYRCHGKGVKGILKVYVRYARNLPDTDPIFNKPDPYVRITAVDNCGNRRIRRSSTKKGTTNPTFNQWIDLGGDTWQFFRIQVWDSDKGKDDAMTQSQTIRVQKYYRSLTHCASPSCKGYLRFSYNLIPDGIECKPATYHLQNL